MGKVNNAVDNDTILALTKAGKSTRQIERITGKISHQTVSKRLKEIMPKEDIQFYKERKADILAEKQVQLLKLTTNPKTKCRLDPADHKNIAIAFGVYEEREARIRGQLPETKPLVIINKIVVNDKAPDVVDVTPSDTTSCIDNV